jgi:uncharacterized RDD family membrane protein YckC
MLEVSQTDLNPYAPPGADNDLAEEVESSQLLRASRSQRLGAAILDGLVMMPLVGLAMMLARSWHLSAKRDHVMYTLLFQAVMLPLSLFQWSLIARTGQSLGKRWVKIKIFKKDGSPVDFVSGVVLRHWLLYLTPVFIGLVMPQPATQLTQVVWFVDIVLIFGVAHRCLHDYIAGTQVLQLPGGSV